MIDDELPLRQADAEDAPGEDPPNVGREESDGGVMQPVERAEPFTFRQEDAEITIQDDPPM